MGSRTGQTGPTSPTNPTSLRTHTEHSPLWGRWRGLIPPGLGPIFSQQKSPRAVRHVGNMKDKLNLTYFFSR